MRKRMTRFILLVLAIAAVIYISQHRKDFPSLSGLFKANEVDIEKTAILVKEINNLSQLITLTAYNEIALDSTKKGWALFNNPMIPSLLNLPNIKQADHHLVLVGKGKILAGINLAAITANDIFMKGDSVSLRLPPAVILQVILNPSGFEVFDETGKWNDDEVKAVKLRLRDKLVANAVEQGILKQAAARAIKLMEQFLNTAGFKKRTVYIRS